MILDSLEDEETADFLDRHTAMVTTLVGGANLNGENRKKLMRDLSQGLERSAIRRTGDRDGVVEFDFVNSSLAVENLHDILQGAGLVGDSNPENTTPDE